MQKDDSDGQDIEQWARQLAGKTSDVDTPSDVKALRRAIVATNQSDREAVAADQTSRARLLGRLEDEGLLDAAAVAKPRPPWHLWASAIAAVLIVAIGVRFALPPEPVYRGFIGDIRITSDAPDAELARITRQLEALGLKPRRVTDDGRVLLEVDVAQEQLEVFYQWAQQRGGRPVTPGKYRILVDAGIARQR